MKLNPGCCDRLLPGYVNLDLVEAPGVTIADLRDHTRGAGVRVIRSNDRGLRERPPQDTDKQGEQGQDADDAVLEHRDAHGIG